MKRILLILLVIPCMQLYAQRTKPNKPIKSFFSGVVNDETNSPLPYVNVTIYKSADSTLSGGTTTNDQGFFKMELLPGNYYLQFSFLSYETKTLSDVTLSNKPVHLGNIQLQQKTELLDEVEISAERSQMELKLDKRVFNIEKDLVNTGANAAEILDNIPSVQVDIEGNISLRGSENVRVLIDGKPSTLTGASTADVLRQFQGSMIERVEVITNPSARYDAEGEVGIINIVLKKEKRKGINGGFEVVAGYPDNYRASFNLNYRTNKLNLFTSYGITYRDSPGFGKNTQRFSNSDTAFVYESDQDRSRASLGNNLRVGTDIFLNKYNTITLAGLYRYSDQENTVDLEYRDLFDSGELFQRINRIDVEDETGENLEADFNYTRTFDQKDRKLTADFRWSESDDIERSNITENNFRNADQLIQQTSNVEANRTILIQSDYIHPLSKGMQIEGGVRTTLRKLENIFDVRESINGSPFVLSDEFNNDFLYDERIYAGYIQFGHELKNFSYQLGLRGEYSDILSDLRRTNESFKQEYFNLFPSAFLTYKVDKSKQFQLSYSRRINRPSYRFLLPFQTFSDNRNLWRGNPNLIPEYTDSYEFGFLRYFDKGSFFSSIYYRYRNNVIERITATTDEGFIERKPINLATENNWGVEITASYNISKKATTNLNLNFYRQIREGNFEGQSLNNDVVTMSGRYNIKFEILPKVDFQASFRYRAPQTNTQGRTLSMYWLDLSAGKDVMKGKGTLTASVRDLFNSRKRRWETVTPNLIGDAEFQWRARQFLMTFSYRINQKKKRNGNRGEFDGSGEGF